MLFPNPGQQHYWLNWRKLNAVSLNTWPEKNRNNPHLVFNFLDELAFNKIVLDVVEDLIGPDIALWGSVLFIKEPQTSHFVSWHQDATYMGMTSNNFVTPWIALSPSNLDTGCMSMIPGSHLQHIKPHDDTCLLYTSPSPRDLSTSRMPSSA